jgi:hypothetical protein
MYVIATVNARTGGFRPARSSIENTPTITKHWKRVKDRYQFPKIRLIEHIGAERRTITPGIEIGKRKKTCRQ